MISSSQNMSDQDERRDYINEAIALHAKMLQENSYCYFELARTRQTEWMLWICSNAREQDPNRKVLVNGQGFTPEDACKNGLELYAQQNAIQSHN